MELENLPIALPQTSPGAPAAMIPLRHIALGCEARPPSTSTFLPLSRDGYRA
jgi:hypothetical protein